VLAALVIATNFLDTNLPHGKLLFELYRRKAVVVAMTPDGVIKHLDVIDYVSPGILSGRIDSALDALTL